MQFYFIRHAQSANNALMTNPEASGKRSEDPELTDIGRKQAKLLGEFLRTGDPRGGYPCNGRRKGFQFTHLYSSLMVRAVATGTEISKAAGVPLEAWMDVHESGGIYLDDEESGEPKGLPGYNRSYFEENYPNFLLPDSLGDEGWWHGRPFEAHEERIRRARRFLAELLERHGGSSDRVAVVSHGGFYNHLLVALLDYSWDEKVWFTMYNTAITRIDFEGERPSIVYSNRVDFLPPDLIT